MDYGMFCLLGCLQLAHISQICCSTEPWLMNCTFVSQAENKPHFSILLISSDPGLLPSAYPPLLQVSHASFLCIFACSRCSIISHILTITKTKPAILIESNLRLDHLDKRKAQKEQNQDLSADVERQIPEKGIVCIHRLKGTGTQAAVLWDGGSVGFRHLETT